MDASHFPNNKRHFDHHSTSDPHHLTTAKRRHPLPSSPATLKLASGETLFRILCPASKAGGVIGKGGAIIRQFREQTGAKIRIDDSTHGSDERLILIAAPDSSSSSNPNAKPKNNNDDSNSEESGNSNNCEESQSQSQLQLQSPAQKALIMIFERILKVDGEDSFNSMEGGGVPVVCRLLAATHQVGCVLGRGGKIIEKIRQESGAQVRVMPKDQLPECASPGDELIQMAGKFLAVKKALLSVSSCLQENPRADAGSNRPMGMVPHGYGTEGIGNHHRIGMEEEVIFRLLCHVDKVGSLIGKGGSIRRALQTETGASIKVADSTPESDERVVVISALESLEQRHSPAQDAVIRVHGRIAEIGFEPGAAIVARLLVHSRQIGCLWGKSGIIISEMRRVTGASIHIFPKDQVAKYGMPNDEVVQVIGSLQCVQDALFQITGRLREALFHMKSSYYYSNMYGPAAAAAYMEMPPPSFRPRHDPGIPFSHPTYYDHVSYPPYPPQGNERPGGYRLSPPSGRWTSQSGGNMYIGGEIGEFEGERGLAAKVNDPSSGRNQTSSGTASVSVEIVIPEALLGCVYGDNLGHIKEISGAKVVTEGRGGVVVVSGTSDETRTAQCLLHAFILCEV